MLAKMGDVLAGWPLPQVSAPLDVIKYYNKGDGMKGFEAAGYFIYKGVLVCENGKEDEVKARLARTSDIAPHTVVGGSMVTRPPSK